MITLPFLSSMRLIYHGFVEKPRPAKTVYPQSISYKERSQAPSAFAGWGPMSVGIPIRATKSSKALGVTCFIIYALAQFFENAKADAIVMVRPVQDLVVAGTRRLLPKSCCTSSTGVSGEKPRSSIACAYKNGFIEEPT